MNAPDKSDWLKLYKAAIKYKEVSPWKWMENEDLFAVENPRNGEVGHCSILGIAKEQYGLGVFLGKEGYKGYIRLVSVEDEPEDFDERIMVPMLSLLFADRGDLQKKDREVIRSLGLQFRGRNTWPLFSSQQPGYAPWFLEKDEAIFLTTVIEQALVVADKVRSNELDLFDKVDEDLVLTRYHRDGNWLEEWRKPEVPDQGSIALSDTIEPVNEARLHLLRHTRDKLSGSWEMDIFILPMPIGPASTRPYFPMCFLAVDRKLGIIVNVRMNNPWLNLSRKQDELMRILENVSQLPSDIRVKSDKIKRVVEPITKRLGIGLQVGSLSVLEEAKASLTHYLSERRS